MLFAELLDEARGWTAGNLPVAVGGVVALLVLVFLVVNTVLRRRELNPARLAAAGATAVTGEKALSWAPPEQSYADRRGSQRREGQPVRVLLASTTFRNGAGDGTATSSTARPAG